MKTNFDPRFHQVGTLERILLPWTGTAPRHSWPRWNDNYFNIINTAVWFFICKRISFIMLSKAVSSTIRRNQVVRHMSVGKQIQFGVEGRAAMLRGVNLLADAVQVSTTPCQRRNTIMTSWQVDNCVKWSLSTIYLMLLLYTWKQQNTILITKTKKGKVCDGGNCHCFLHKPQWDLAQGWYDSSLPPSQHFTWWKCLQPVITFNRFYERMDRSIEA